MKCIGIISFLIISYGAMCQSMYVAPPIKEIQDLNNTLANRNRANHKAYNDFISEKLNSLDKDTSSIKYKSEIYAIGRFTNTFKTIEYTGRWEDADIETAKSSYYLDIYKFITNSH